MSSWQEATNIGNILIRQGAVCAEKLAEAVQKQAEEREANPGAIILLGEVCIGLGLITQDQLTNALEEQRRLLAPASNAAAVDDVFRKLDAEVKKAKRSSTKLVAVSEQFAFSRSRG